MNVGTYVKQGISHIHCQDYAHQGNSVIIGSREPCPFVVLSDGCSTAPYTDFGARVLVRAACRFMRDACQHPDTIREILIHAENCIGMMELPTDSLRATLAFAKVELDKVQVRFYGDGVVFQKKKDGTCWFRELKFDSGAPFYPIYITEPNARETYTSKFGNKATFTTYSGTVDKLDIVEEKLELPVIDEYDCWRESFSLDETEFVAIMSDGASSFIELINNGTSKHNEPIGLANVVRTLMDFPDFANLFVVNQCRWLFEKDSKGSFRRQGWKNSDDFSIGVIHCG